MKSNEEKPQEGISNQESADEQIPSAAVTVSAAEYEILKTQATELQATKDRMLRVVADYENVKRRFEKQKDEFLQFANKNIIHEFLPIIDNLERALTSAKSNHSVESLMEGVALVNKQMLDILKGHGLERIDAKGKKFDPHMHEAIGSVESDEHDDETVIEEITPGYTFKETLLRPAVVRISAKK